MIERHMIYSDIPSDEPCWLVNSRLWKDFCYTYELQEGKAPAEQWSEAEVTQWLDIFAYEMDYDQIRI
jgi:hypothetical protein